MPCAANTALKKQFPSPTIPTNPPAPGATTPRPTAPPVPGCPWRHGCHIACGAAITCKVKPLAPVCCPAPRGRSPRENSGCESIHCGGRPCLRPHWRRGRFTVAAGSSTATSQHHVCAGPTQNGHHAHVRRLTDHPESNINPAGCAVHRAGLPCGSHSVGVPARFQRV